MIQDIETEKFSHLKMFTAGGRRFVWNLFIIVLIFCILIIINTPQRMTPLPKQVVGWEANITRETKIYVVPENDTSIISGRGICKGSFDLIIVVFSAPENFAQRNAIRETWGSYNTSNFRVAFLLGCSKNSTSQLLVEEENAEFQDLIQEDFIDSYNNLTVKSVMMLKWFLSKCPSPTLLMKTDDDMFINIEYLSALISKLSSHSVLIGTLICKAKPILDATNKWYTPRYIYQKPFYPNYVSGTGYLMSQDVASKLYRAALSTPLMHLEDVYLTGICAAKAGITPRNHPGFSYEHFGIGCDTEMVTNHHLNPQELRQVWNMRNNCTTRIKPPTIKPKPLNPCH
ncbi:beta-1,3-galactosyltransferase 1 isoform X2 [Halyomorpha halys]|uniref:beta-1,3-galactosyltransferase 1 isoform X2 n=1 Tax=Halyomorpha halys TaxID=286706 RepID=UPI0006D5219A|nr:beta-1,3-galactosyltransferase 1 isoform X2 [Halyomorpha halys]